MTYQIQSSFAENFKIITDTNISIQQLTTSYAYATGSQIDYVPSPSSSLVVYQYSVHLSQGGSSSELNAQFKLQYSDDNGGTFSDWGDNTEVYLGSAGTFMKSRTVVDIKFCLSASGWDNTKRLRLVVLEDSGSTTALHQLDQDFQDDANLYEDQKYFPSVSCYSVE